MQILIKRRKASVVDERHASRRVREIGFEPGKKRERGVRGAGRIPFCPTAFATGVGQQCACFSGFARSRRFLWPDGNAGVRPSERITTPMYVLGKVTARYLTRLPRESNALSIKEDQSERRNFPRHDVPRWFDRTISQSSVWMCSRMRLICKLAEEASLTNEKFRFAFRKIGRSSTAYLYRYLENLKIFQKEFRIERFYWTLNEKCKGRLKVVLRIHNANTNA